MAGHQSGRRRSLAPIGLASTWHKGCVIGFRCTGWRQAFPHATLRSRKTEPREDYGSLNQLKAMTPSLGQSLIDDPALCRRVRTETAAISNTNKIDVRETQHDSSLSVVHRA